MNPLKLLRQYPTYLVGSVLNKNNPRDIDIICVIPNKNFEKIFKISPKKWRTEGLTGNWSKERWEWCRLTISTCKILARRLNSNVDFKFIPKLVYYMEPNEVKES